MPSHPQLSTSLFRSEGHRLPGSRTQRARGVTLAELMVATTLFSLMALSTLSALLQSRKISEDNVAQATAGVIAQGIIEQVQLNAYADISDTSGTTPNLELKFTGSNTNNLASIQQFNLPWAANATTFTQIGALTDPAVPTSAIRGVLIDLDYMVGTKVVRPARYMKMMVNIRRTVNDSDHNTQVVLTYSWQPPSRNRGVGTAVYVTREIRTIRSEAASF